MTIHIYAEHLANIRTLSIQVTLSQVSDDNTNVIVSEEGNCVTVTQKDEAQTIILPVNVKSDVTVPKLILPAKPTNHLSFRIPVAGKPEHGLSPRFELPQETNIVPWTASTLSSESELSCTRCESVIIPRGRIKLWKDLPSENWAEMMDFWHCHRPHELPSDDQETPRKGYSADSVLAMSSGVGMTDSMSFLCMAGDCQNLNVSPNPFTNHPDDKIIICQNCQSSLGFVDPSTTEYKLRKIHLSVSVNPSRPAKSYTPDKWLACHLLSSIEQQGVRKFMVSSSGLSNKQTRLKLWIFAPYLKVSSSTPPPSTSSRWPTKMVKVLWQPCDEIEGTPIGDGSMLLNRQALSEAEMEIPRDQFGLLQEALAAGGGFLPASGKEFQGWRVALVPRFSVHDL